MRPALASWLLAVAACTSAPSSRALQTAAPLPLYPTPRYAAEQPLALPVATACVDDAALADATLLAARLPALLAAVGLRAVPAGAGCDLTLAFDAAPPPDLDAAAAAAFDPAAPDGYVVLGRAAAGRAVVRLWAESGRAALYAVATALALVDAQRRFHPAVVVDAPAIATRGLIEGYYGPPLSPAQRGCLLETMATLRQNLYLYGPKDDPFAHERWAEPYPDDGAAAIAAAAAAARARGIDFVWAVSPGLLAGAPPPGTSISFASAADFARLTAKLDAMRALGVDRFALFLDDITADLVYDADRAAFATPAAAHVDLANRIDAYATAAGLPHPYFVGYVYSKNWDGWQPYVATVGAALAPGVELLWTGPHVYSATISAADVLDVDQLAGRDVVIWDNEPDTPVALDGRTPDLAGAIAGFLSNTVMIEQGYGFDDLRGVVGTLADWAWTPAAYAPAPSLQAWQARAQPCVSAP